MKSFLPKEIPLPPLPVIMKGLVENRKAINMNEVVGSHDILFICLDCLRYDVALAEQENGGTPVLNQYGPWEKRSAPGNFTYPSHHAMFAGFLPAPIEPTPMTKKNMLFFPKGTGMGMAVPPNAFAFAEATFVQGLEKLGYETICIGGVSYFSKRSAMGRVFPSMFRQSFWQPSFGCTVKESPDKQIAKAVSVLAQVPEGKPVMLYINFDAIHYPNYFYLDERHGEGGTGVKRDSLASHAAALRYIDQRLPLLFAAFAGRGKTFVIACADHGTCYEESDDGHLFHGFSHESVNTVPYKHFFLNH